MTGPSGTAEKGRLSPALLLSAVVAVVFLIALARAHHGGPAAAPSPVAAAPAGMELTIPKIGVDSSLIGLGLNPDRTLAVPSLDAPMQASWYTGGPVPGDVGPAVVLGHIDAHGRPAVFYRLRELGAGDQVKIRRADGSVATFTVVRKEEAAKTRFPTQEVYANTPAPELRLITCAGSFDRAKHSYRDNIIVFAKLDNLTGPAAS